MNGEEMRVDHSFDLFDIRYDQPMKFFCILSIMILILQTVLRDKL